ncbi:MAG: AzlC family ABC transporter permease [Holophagales bacterium]|nr:AzlC family ABC transporter permease [Holophagales bacterium]
MDQEMTELERAATFRDGMRRVFPLAVSAGAFAVTLGLLAAAKGMSAVQIGLMSAWVFAGASQLVAVEIWTAPLPMATLVATTLVINARHLLMGATLAPWLGRHAWPSALFSTFFMVDENWALSMDEQRRGSYDKGFLLGSGLTLYVLWLAGTLIGHQFGAVIAAPEKLGLDFAGVAIFLGLLLLMAPSRTDLVPIGVAIAVTALLSHLSGGQWHVLAGAVVGASTAALRDPAAAESP